MLDLNQKVSNYVRIMPKIVSVKTLCQSYAISGRNHPINYARNVIMVEFCNNGSNHVRSSIIYATITSLHEGPVESGQSLIHYSNL